jgi:phosphoserine phosphatase
MSQADLEKQIADLNAVLDVARRMGAATELDALLNLVIGEAMRVLDAERASLFLYDRATHELFSKIAVGTGEIRFQADRGIAGAAAIERRTIHIPDAYADVRFNREVDLRTGWRTRNILACPLLGVEGQLVGVLQALNKRGGPFDDRDCRLAETLAAQAGVALERSRLMDQYVANQRLARELQVAQSIQRRLLPQQAPRLSSFDIAAWSQPAAEAGGDCFDFLELPDGRLVFSVGDATGHGIGPALISTECRALVRATATLRADVSQVLRHVNELICSDLSDGHFVTFFLGLLDPTTRRIVYASAGQAPLLVVRPTQETVTALDATGLPLGIVSYGQWDLEQTLELDCGDILAILTDGFFEWSRPDGEQFGSGRAGAYLLSHAGAPAAELIAGLHRAVIDFAEGTAQQDDLTAVLVKRMF